MNKYIFVSAAFFLAGAGCAAPAEPASDIPSTGEAEVVETLDQEASMSLPLDEAVLTYKRFGEFFQDRFSGFHVGEDFEVDANTPDPIPVYAIADGVVSRASRVGGYGGLVTVVHTVEGQVYTGVYGHLSTDFMVEMGEEVRRGEQIGVLGADASEDTDGERRHLHFAMHEGKSDVLSGYEGTADAIEKWINPRDFLSYHGAGLVEESQQYSDLIDPQGKEFFGGLDFFLPAGWDVEYIPSIQALNLYETSGDGTARDRSQMLVRYFDASDFLTLSTVNIFDTTDMTVGQGDYVARRYDIEKKDSVADFPAQPDWRNERHIVTDFRLSDGQARYYVVAAAPWVDTDVYEDILASMAITP